VRKVLLEHVNVKIVEAINQHGGRATQVPGEDRRLLVARRAVGPDGRDLGFVGEVERVNASLLDSLLEYEFVPVVAPVGSGIDGIYNINADRAAGSLAAALKAAKIVFLTNVEGLYRDFGDQGSLIPQTTVSQVKALLEGNGLSSGMIPKIRSLVEAMEAGVSRGHILDGRQPHALLLEIFTDEGVGTMVLP
jgi:acetylglutamate kinase